jgi:hypothetical protein
MTTEQQHAIQHKVPFLETCKALDWKLPTIFSYVEYTKLNEFFLFFVITLGEEYATGLKLGYNPYENNFCFYNFRFKISDVNIIPAPTFDEIWERLPKKIESDRLFEDDLVLNGNTFYYRSEFLEWIENSHLSEAAAQLYIKLKTENLLPQ